MFLNSDLHNKGATHSGSFRSTASESELLGPGMNRYAKRLEPATVMVDRGAELGSKDHRPIARVTARDDVGSRLATHPRRLVEVEPLLAGTQALLY